MLRGCQKQMIVLQTPESRLFESAFFVLRREMGAVEQDDMIAEANRIVGSGYSLRKRGRCAALKRVGPFLTGVLFGAGAFALICFLRLI